MESPVTAALLMVGALCWALPVRQNSLQCDLGKQYGHLGRCCNKCPPGTHMKAKCTSTANTTCSPCGPNEYMSVWNEDLKCTLHMVCDPGKVLRVTFNGNSTYPRECECIEGYHFDTKQEICMENVKCPPGSGVQIPVQSNKNTVCVPCPVGYYSNSTSATDGCTRWTNCTDLGLQEIVPGSNMSDAFCDRYIVPQDLTKVVILIIFPVVASGIVICIIYAVCHRKKFSAFIAQLQDWLRQSCDQEHESQLKTPFSDQGEDCIHKTYAFSEECSLLKESVVPQGRMIPTENEYMDPRGSPEPENESMVARMGSTSDSEIGCPGTFLGFSDTSSDRLLSPSQEEGVSIPLYSHHHCGQSAKEIQDNSARDPVDNVCGHYASQHTFHVFSQAAHPTPERSDGEEPCSCCTDRQFSRNGSSASSTPTTDIPPPSSGNHTTVLSTAPVMNIKTDLVVVYYNASSQDTHTAAETEDTTSRPMQEENQSHYDSFVANTQSPRYTDIPCSSVSDTDTKMFADELTSPSCLDTFSQDQPNIFFSPNTNVLPVQEEGKPEFYL
ncbi:tumor necrosis factor receptor superfamily member 11A [Bufo gargarizans]|uniref:tumor necrosis factor receptor superfamily member 11A n=1 Tax=Bufo gargarizans TaxID=30331 RepID=UPI001CF4FA4F|nr:tumor necrosis factor receptor superfamily member 11A [Bufo gargarizans]